VSDYADYQEPQGNASAIYDQRVPLAANSEGAVIGSAITATPSTAYNSATVAIDQLGYEIVLALVMPSSATVPFAEVILTWSDASSGFTLAQDCYYVAVGQTGTSMFTVGTGPAKADQVQVEIIDLDPAQTITGQIAVIASSRIYPTDRWHWWNRQNKTATVPGFTLASLTDDDLSLGILSAQSIGESANKTWLFGPAPGQVITLAGNTSTAPAADVQLVAQAAPSGTYGAGGLLLVETLVTSYFTFQFTGPRAPWTLKVTNSDASAGLVISTMAVAAVQ